MKNTATTGAMALGFTMYARAIVAAGAYTVTLLVDSALGFGVVVPAVGVLTASVVETAGGARDVDGAAGDGSDTFRHNRFLDS